MIRNITVAEDNTNLLCQDTGIPIYNVVIGSNVAVDGHALKQAIISGCTRATKEHPLRSSVVHPTTRKNEHTSGGRHVPVINIDFSPQAETLSIEMIPKGSGSENNSWLRMAIPAEGIDAIKTFVIDCVLEAGGKSCPPVIVGPAATHITMNPVAVNMQCHSARRARATFTPQGLSYGY